jgi:hypothetical protein
MSVTVSPKAADLSDVIVRGLRESDLALADAILRSAFDTFTGDHVELGVNTGRQEAYAAVMARGYRAELVGVSMHRGNDEGYNRPGTWLIDDWR